MPDRKTVMINSIARDLPKHREQVMDACLRQGMFSLMMEHLPASDADAIEVSLKMVEEADIYLGIFAWRYGYVPPRLRPWYPATAFRDGRIVGSYNWTDAGAYDNDENTPILHDRERARAYDAEWQRLWATVPLVGMCNVASVSAAVGARRNTQLLAKSCSEFDIQSSLAHDGA